MGHPPPPAPAPKSDGSPHGQLEGLTIQGEPGDRRETKSVLQSRKTENVPSVPRLLAAPFRFSGLGEIAAVWLHFMGRDQFEQGQTRGSNHHLAFILWGCFP